MSKLALVYGLRLLPAEELNSVADAELQLKNGRTASVTMHLIEGENEEQIRQRLFESLDTFFEFYPGI